ncbi:transaldolase [Neisseriaceae bacterium ESL0693]|nr:transaldolase [Neisseriaceae bacterium ESL0693]
MTVLNQVAALGQQIWLDNLSRSLIQSGQLDQWLEKGISGLTSNPAILQKALTNDALYADEVRALKQQSLTPEERYETLVIADVQAACDRLRPLYQKSAGVAGFVSLEVSPQWAHDGHHTINEARRLWQEIKRDNVMIKIPATAAGIEAMQVLVAEGLNINLTLLFSRAQVVQAYQAHARGIQQRLQQQLPVKHIQTVASFFLSRIDTALDPTLPPTLQGQAAISLARMAYADWQNWVGSAQFQDLAAQGANPVKLLWASTATKNPAYSDVYYVDNVIGAQTVNTVPEHTLAAFCDHGQAIPSLIQNRNHAQEVLAQLQQSGIDLEALASRLQQQGLIQFEEAFAALLQLLA